MPRFTIRDVLWLMVVVAVAFGMYAAWQADRAMLALRLSQAEASATMVVPAAPTVAPIANEPYVVREFLVHSIRPNGPETVLKVYSNGSLVHETRAPGDARYGTAEPIPGTKYTDVAPLTVVPHAFEPILPNTAPATTSDP